MVCTAEIEDNANIVIPHDMTHTNKKYRDWFWPINSCVKSMQTRGYQLIPVDSASKCNSDSDINSDIETPEQEDVATFLVAKKAEEKVVQQFIPCQFILGSAAEVKQLWLRHNCSSNKFEVTLGSGRRQK